jgi:hypothetical protein
MLALNLSLDPISGDISAMFDAASGHPAPSLEELQKVLEDAGYATGNLDKQAIIDFSIACRGSAGVVGKILGRVKHAEFSLQIADDLMSVQLSLIPPQGGLPITTQIDDALREHGITYGIDHQALEAAMAQGQCENITIAKGDAPTAGVHGRFDVLFQAKKVRVLEDEDHAVIKLSDLGNILLVEPNEQLMRRIPPIQGKNGYNVKGEIILAKPIPEMPFAAELPGAQPDEADPNLLISNCAGQPKQVPNGVMVKPVIDVENVDLSTGNINFDGTINIAGDIKTGMTIKVTGDVFVSGMIESADITAGHDVIVKHGIIGKSDAKTNAQQVVGAGSAKIRCGGSLKAQFIEHAHIEAHHCIEVEQSVLQSELIAGDQIIVGKKNPQRCHIIGGRTQATHLVKTGCLGSGTGVKTIVQVGIDPYLNQEIARKEKVHQQKILELDSVIKLLVHCQGKDAKKFPAAVIEKAETTRMQLIGDIEELNLALADLGAQLELAEKAKVVVDAALYGGTQISIGKQEWKVSDEQGACTVLLDGGKIAISR